jgi:hypothetical protein
MLTCVQHARRMIARTFYRLRVSRSETHIHALLTVKRRHLSTCSNSTTLPGAVESVPKDTKTSAFKRLLNSTRLMANMHQYRNALTLAGAWPVVNRRQLSLQVLSQTCQSTNLNSNTWSHAHASYSVRYFSSAVKRRSSKSNKNQQKNLDRVKISPIPSTAAPIANQSNAESDSNGYRWSPPPPPPRHSRPQWFRGWRKAAMLGIAGAVVVLGSTYLAYRKFYSPEVPYDVDEPVQSFMEDAEEAEVILALQVLRRYDTLNVVNDVAISAARGLARLALKSDRNRVIIATNGGISILADMALDCRAPAQLLRHIAQTFDALSRSEELRGKIVRIGGFPLLLAVLCQFAEMNPALFQRQLLADYLPGINPASRGSDKESESESKCAVDTDNVGAETESDLVDGRLIPILMTLRAADNCRQTSGDMNRIMKVYDAWSASDESLGTSGADVSRMVQAINNLWNRSQTSNDRAQPQLEPGRKVKMPIDDVHYLSVRALGSLSDASLNRERILALGGVQHLYDIVMAHPTEWRLQAQVARCLANLAFSPEAAAEIVRVGFLPLLHSWAQIEDPSQHRTRFQSVRALANMRSVALHVVELQNNEAASTEQNQYRALINQHLRLGMPQLGNLPFYRDEVFPFSPALRKLDWSSDIDVQGNSLNGLGVVRRAFFALRNRASKNSSSQDETEHIERTLDRTHKNSHEVYQRSSKNLSTGAGDNSTVSEDRVKRVTKGRAAINAFWNTLLRTDAASEDSEGYMGMSLFRESMLEKQPPMSDGVGHNCKCKEPLDEGTALDIVFVHGLLGSPFYTWRISSSSPTGAKLTLDEDEGEAMRVADRAGDPSYSFEEHDFDSNMNSTTSPELLLQSHNDNAGAVESVADTTDSSATSSSSSSSSSSKPERADPDSKVEAIWPAKWLPHSLCSCSGNIRVISIGYRTFLSTWSGETKPLEVRSRNFLQKLELARVGMPDGRGVQRKVVFVTHSMGGLLVKQMLDHASTNAQHNHLFQHTIGICFFGTPHFGTWYPELASYVSYIFRPTRELVELHRNAPHLIRLNERLRSFRHIQSLSFGESKSTPFSKVNVVVVPAESSNPGYGQFALVESDHINICKPMSPHDPTYVTLVDFIRDCVRRAAIHDEEVSYSRQAYGARDE